MKNTCWSTSTYIYVEPRYKKPKTGTSVMNNHDDQPVICDEDKTAINKKKPKSISSWYNLNESVAWNYLYACNNGIDVKKHSLYNYVYKQKRRNIPT